MPLFASYDVASTVSVAQSTGDTPQSSDCFSSDIPHTSCQDLPLINTNNVPPVSLAQQSLYVHSASPVTKHHAQFLSAVNHDSAYSAFHNCSLSQHPAHPRALDFSSHLIHVDASVNGAFVSDISIDTAADVPCVSATFIRGHPTLNWDDVRPVPPEAINLRSADGSVLEV